jgi:hypothetical protein
MTGRARVEWWFSAPGAIRWLLIVGVYTEARVARLVLSRWPRPVFDDPKQFAPAPLDWAVNVRERSFSCHSVADRFGRMELAQGSCRLAILSAYWRIAAGLLASFILSVYDSGRVWG